MTQRGRADFYADGDWNVVCYECGRKRKASMLEKNWQGFYVCPEHNEPRQPQDFAKGIPDVQTPPWVQPMPADLFDVGDYLLTESSDEINGVLIYILTETLYPITTE